MAQASIPVDLFNPGQVFACLGFLEAAEVLLGHAEGGFDWARDTEPRFELRGNGEENPFHVTLRFLASAKLQLAPTGYSDQAPKETKKKRKAKINAQAASDEGDDAPTGDGALCAVDTFPTPVADRLTLPVRLVQDGCHLDLTHWCDASSRNPFKLFAGQQQSAEIARQMIAALCDLWRERESELIQDPFGVTAPLGGSSFKFDARKAWTAIGAGYSPDEQENAVEASPVVELLAAAGLEHARPDEFATREVRYGVWKGLLPPILARPALAGVSVGVPMRLFRFTLELAGKNKIVTFAEEDTKL